MYANPCQRKAIKTRRIFITKSELQKLEAGDWYRVDDSEVAARKLNSATRCQEFNAIPENEPEKQAAKVREIFGSAGKNIVVHSRLNVDYGKNIHVGDNFLANLQSNYSRYCSG